MKETKNTYIEDLQTRLSGFRLDLKKIELSLKKAGTSERERLKKQIKTLKQKGNDFEQRIQPIREAKDDAWEHLKEDSESIWGGIKEAFKHKA